MRHCLQIAANAEIPAPALSDKSSLVFDHRFIDSNFSNPQPHSIELDQFDSDTAIPAAVSRLLSP